jgi:hypothetical protein
MLVVLLSGLSAGCIIPLPAKATVAQSGDLSTPSGEIALAVLFSRDFSPDTPRSSGEKMVECITRGLAKAATEVRLVPEEEFYRAIFGLKPDEVMLREDTIGTLLLRPDIRRRVGASGLTHLILVRGGGTSLLKTAGSGGFVGFAGGMGGIGTIVGYDERIRSTQFAASIFELVSGRVGAVEASAEGQQDTYVILPLVVGQVYMTESASCDALGSGVARAISGRPRDESR